MTSRDIVRWRLRNQRLAGAPCTGAEDVVRMLGAVQAQDYAAAKWSVGLRSRNATDDEIERALDEGTLLRTHVLRPTWHFVLPTDIRALLDLTAPRVRALLASSDRKLELTAVVLSRSRVAIRRALRGGKYLTRQELAECLERAGISARGQRLGHVMVHAELDGVVCSGPRRGKRFTYALLDERVPIVTKTRRDDVRANLALRYFTSHGPAQLTDFAWWSGLSARDAAEGLDSVKSRLRRALVDSKEYWLPAVARAPARNTSTAFLLSIFDEYVIAYKDRAAVGETSYLKRFFGSGTALASSIVLVNGQIAGTWNRSIRKDAVDISVMPSRRLSNSEREAVARAAEKYGKFLGMRVTASVLT